MADTNWPRRVARSSLPHRPAAFGRSPYVLAHPRHHPGPTRRPCVVLGVAAVVGVLALFELLRPAHHPQQPGRHRREALVGQGLGARRPDHRPQRRGRLPGRPAARRHPLRPVALAVPHPQGPAGHDAAGQDRLRLRPRRRAAAAEPDARPRRAVQQLPGRPRLPRRASRTARPASQSRGQRGRQRAILREGVYAINLGAVRRHHRGRGLPPATAGGAQELQDARQLAERARARSTASTRSSSAARSRRPTRSTPSRRCIVDSIGIVTVHDGPSLPPGEIIAPAVGNDARTTRTTTTTTRTPRRSCAPAAAAAGSTCR